MFLFFLLCLGVVLFARQWMALNAPEVKKLLFEAQTLEFNQLTHPHHRCEDMERELGTPWLEWDPANAEASDFAPPTVPIHFVRRYFGPMDMEVGGDQVLIYDMLTGLLSDPANHGNLFQTVISFKPPELLRLPPFILRPHVGFMSQFSTGDPIKTDTSLDTTFNVESFAPHRVRALFQSELGTEVLIPFLMDHKWTVEWDGKQLIVYQLNHLIAPSRIAEVALEATELFECLKSGPDVVDRMMRQFIDSAVAKR